MEIKQKIVKILYWDCGIDAHRHKSKDVALRCIEKNKGRKKRNLPLERLDGNLRKVRATMEAVKGRTLAEVGKSFGISGSRIASYIYMTARLSHLPKRNLVGDSDTVTYDIKVMRKNKKEFLDRFSKLEDILIKEYHDKFDNLNRK